MAARKDKFRSMHKDMIKVATSQAAIGWDASPVSVPRLCMEVWDQIKDLDWSMLGASPFQSFWAQRLWDFDTSSTYGHVRRMGYWLFRAGRRWRCTR